MTTRSINKLSFQRIKNLKADGLYSDGGGLYLAMKGGNKRWVFIYKRLGKRREMGLGSLINVPLQVARDKAAEARAALAVGVDPINARDQKTLQALTFGEFATNLIDELAAGWKNPRYAEQWRFTLKTHGAKIWGMQCSDVDTDHVLKVLRPIWKSMPATARQLRARIERVLDAAKVRGLRTGDNPARWRGHLEHLLPKSAPSDKHHPALPYEDAPRFMVSLAKKDGISFRALELVVLNVCRASEACEARWREVDLSAKTWTIPAARMKMKKEHVIPLSEQSVSLFRKLLRRNSKPSDYIFEGQAEHVRRESLRAGIIRMVDDATTHGFRSTFRDWAGDETDHAEHLIEMCLAHLVGSRVQRAYRRRDALDKRRVIMQDWADYVMPIAKQPEPEETPDPERSDLAELADFGLF